MRLLRFLLAACALLAAGRAPAADSWAPANRLDAWFDELAKDPRVNGSIAISEKGRLRYQRSLGFARLENGVPQPADVGTRYRIGPVSRLFTAVLTMQLAEKASITLDTPVAEFYADLPNALLISYRDLLQSRSGLSDYFDAADFTTWRAQPRTHAQMLAAITAGGVKFPPRQRVELSNSNYLLLGYVVEKVRERRYDDVLQQSIVKLGLSRTYLAGTRTSTLESLAYQPSPDGWIAVAPSDASVLGGAAGVISSAGDLVQYIDALFAGKLVTAQSLATLREPAGELAAGVPQFMLDRRAGFGLQGSLDGFSAFVFHLPEPELSIAFTGNTTTVPMMEICGEALTTVLTRGHRPKLSN